MNAAAARIKFCCTVHCRMTIPQTSRINHRSGARALEPPGSRSRRLLTHLEVPTAPVHSPCIHHPFKSTLHQFKPVDTTILFCSLAFAVAPSLSSCSTARGRSGRGRALLMLLPEELSFLKYLKVCLWEGWVAWPLHAVSANHGRDQQAMCSSRLSPRHPH